MSCWNPTGSSDHERAASPPARTALATLVLFGATWTGAASAHSVTPAVVKPTQELAALLSAHEAFSQAARDSAPLGLVQAQRPITGERTVLPVLGDRTGADGLRWLHVRLPGRPNGQTGWIRQRATVASTTSWHIVVDTSRRRVAVYQQGRRVRVFKAVVGKHSTPTPGGEFFVEEAIQLRAADVGAPFALALSARSNVLQEFDGGPGQIGLHGLANVGGVLGSAVSHGCVRLDNDAMRWLVLRIGPGVPVTIKSSRR
jgi:lipoprotein-anchoring transpeptidase ErfK/SrfK